MAGQGTPARTFGLNPMNRLLVLGWARWPREPRVCFKLSSRRGFNPVVRFAESGGPEGGAVASLSS